jgi:hypothetical protein
MKYLKDININKYLAMGLRAESALCFESIFPFCVSRHYKELLLVMMVTEWNIHPVSFVIVSLGML